MRQYGLSVAGVLCGTFMLAGCGTAGSLGTATATQGAHTGTSGVKEPGNTSITQRSSASSVATSIPSSNSPASPSRNTGRMSTRKSVGTSVVVSTRTLPRGRYTIEPGVLVSESPGMIWGYTPSGPSFSVRSGRSMSLPLPADVTDVALFSESKQVLLGVYPITADDVLKLISHKDQWIITGTLPPGRYRIVYGTLERNPNTTALQWGWARLGSSQIVTASQGTFEISMKAPSVQGASNPGFAVFNQDTNALIGFLSPRMSVVTTPFS